MNSNTIKKIAQIGWSAAICAVLAVPCVMLTVRELSAQPDDSAGNAENRVLAARPSLRTEDNTYNPFFPSQLEAWFGEQFGLRSQMVTAYGKLTGNLFGVSAEPSVIIGKDGWLYYADTVPDATGVRTLSDTEISHMAHNLSMMSDYAASKGTRLIFAAAPNKASIYPEYLPARYLHTGGKNNLDLLREALAETDVCECNWRGMLRDEAKKGSSQLYHKLDTHWNNDGAMRGYTMLMASAGMDSRGWLNAPRTETQDWTGDLWQMLYPTEERFDRNAVYDIPQTYQPIGRMRSVDDMTIRTQCSGGSGSLLMFRDSFGRALIPLLSERFAACTYSRAEAVPLDILETAPTDLAVYELVERNLSRLLTHAPKMPAPQADLPAQTTAEAAEPISLTAWQDGNYLHCFGLYDPAYADADAVFATIVRGESAVSYEAFCCCEQEALSLPSHTANGFSLYLPEDCAADGDTLRITVRKDGRYLQIGETPVTVTAPDAAQQSENDPM